MPSRLALRDLSIAFPASGGEATVVRGVDPRPFAVEVIGKFDDGVLPDHDVILFRASDLPGHEFIAKNGIWAGMSGSPVYIDVSSGYSSITTNLGFWP